MMKEFIAVLVMGAGQNSEYISCPRDGVETIISKLDNLKYEIGDNIILTELSTKNLKELKQGMKKIEHFSLESLIPKGRNYVPKHIETISDNHYYGVHNFYKNPYLGKPEFYGSMNNRFHKHKQGITGIFNEIKNSRDVRVNYKNEQSFELVYLKKEKMQK